MVRIRLRRVGMRGRPYYRIVVADQRAAAKGKFIEQIGVYDPLQNPPKVEVDGELARKWLANGAQPTEAVAHMLQNAGVMPKEGAVANAQ